MGVITFVHAQAGDLPFIIDAIIESEKAGSNFVSYCTLFNISETELRKTIMQLFEDEIEHTPWHLPNWTIGKLEQECICALSSWIEKPGLGADAIKFQAMHYYLKNRIDPQQLSLQLYELQQVAITRIAEFLQLEHLYTAQPYRGKGYIKQLMHHVMNEHRGKTAQIQLTANNKQALKAYMECGFKIEETKCHNGLVASKLLADDCKLNLTSII
jgi:GNAT superfamily N-acetyltransferase